MDKQTRVSRIVRRFLAGRFSAATEERVQRWLAEERDEAEKEAASLEFWESLDARPELNRRSWERVAARVGIRKVARPVRRWAGVAAAIAIPLMVVAGGLIYRAEVRRAEAERVAVETAAKIETALKEPLMFEGASVDEIFAALEERFGVTVTADDTFRGRTELYTVKFPKGDSLENILDVLGDVIGEFEYTRTGNNITITAK